MATYFVASGGSNTAPYDTWAKAATSLATALAAATSSGDVVVIQYNAVPTTDAELSLDTTYTFAGDIFLISASNDGGSAYTPTAMGTANWIGNSTTNRSITFAGNDRECFVWGLTLRTAGSTVDNIVLQSSGGQVVLYDNCYFWSGNTAPTSDIRCTAVAAVAVCRSCTFRFGATAQRIANNGTLVLLNCSVSADGSIPSTLFLATTGGAVTTTCIGCDWSNITGTLVGDCQGPLIYIFERCKLGAGVTILATQTSNPSSGSGQVSLLDCASGDTHGIFGYYNALGSAVTDTGVYYTSGAAGQSWRITTTSLANRVRPFVTPWIDLYNTSTSAITPYLEILRDGSTTAFTDQEVWVEFSAKTDATSPRAATLVDDRDTLVDYLAGSSATSQEAGAGLGSWTGEGGTAWSGKLTAPSSITPTDPGSLRARVYVAVASNSQLYIDPQIRT